MTAIDAWLRGRAQAFREDARYVDRELFTCTDGPQRQHLQVKAASYRMAADELLNAADSFVEDSR